MNPLIQLLAFAAILLTIGYVALLFGIWWVLLRIKPTPPRNTPNLTVIK